MRGSDSRAVLSTVQQSMIDLQFESSVQERFDILKGVRGSSLERTQFCVH